MAERTQHAPRLADLFPLVEVHQRLPRPTHKATPYTWANPGIRGVRLRVTAVGGTLHTCEAWLMAFFEALAAARREGDANDAGGAA